MWRMDDISPATLADREGQLFTVGGVPMRLTALARTDHGTAGSLSATFAGEAPHELGQDVVVVSHADLADTDLLVVPSTATDVVVTFTWLAP